MDTTAFLAEFPGCYVDGDLERAEPLDPRHAAIAGEIDGFTTPAVLALLNLAASKLDEGEAYLEVGTFKGRSLCAAVQGVEDHHFYAVENLLEFGMLGAEARAELMSNLDRWTDRERLTFLEGDSFDLLARKDLFAHPLGVYFYDGAHTRLTHYLAPGVAEPLLADEALVLIDDASWPIVRDETLRYVRRHAGWEVLTELRAAHENDPRWANGLMILRYRRPPGQARTLPRDVAALRPLAVHVESRIMSAGWRFLHRFPRAVPMAKRLFPAGKHRVEDEA